MAACGERARRACEQLGLDLPARARRHEVLLAPSLELGHEGVIAEEA
jgi:hypothetical protein